MTSPATRRRIRVVLAGAVLMLLVPVLGPAAADSDPSAVHRPGPAAADPDPAADSTSARAAQGPQLLALDVARIHGTVTPGAGMRLLAEVHNDTAGPREGLSLTTSVHPRVISRYDYHRALDEGEAGAALIRWTVDLDPVAPGATARVAVRRTAEELAPVRAQGQGVFPVELALVEDGEIVDALTTAIVVTPEEIDQPLRVSVLAPFEPPPPDGDPLLDRDARGSLTALARELDRGTPVTVAIDGFLLDEAARLADASAPGAGGLPTEAAAWSDLLAATEELGAADDVEVIARPYAAADLTALVRGGLSDVAIDAVHDSRAAVARHTGIDPDDRLVWPAAGVDGPTVEHLLEEGVESIVLTEEHLAIPPLRELPTSPAPVRTITAAGGSVAAVVPDPWLSATLQSERRRGSAVAAQRLLAETAVVFFERPFAADPRGVVVAGQQGTASDRYTPALLDRIAASPWLAPVTTTQLLADVIPADTPAELASPGAFRSHELPADHVAALRRARERLQGIASSIEGDDGALDELSTDLQVAASTWYRDPAALAAGRARIRSVQEAVGAVERAVAVADLPVTLASVEGELPVTLRSDATVPLRVRVSAASQRYEFVGGPEKQVVLEPGRATTVLFGVRARAPGGTHPVRVTVTDDRGAVVLAQGTVVVRSTAVSVAALAITIGAALFLAGWWVRDARRRRRAAGAPADASVAVASGDRG